MITFISNYKKGILRTAALIFISQIAIFNFSSCSSMLDTESDMIEFAEDNKLSTPEDSLYSVMGIIRQMQVIADRTVLLGEVRADLVQPTVQAKTALKQMAKLDFSEANEYNQVSDFYAVINNCNYFLANADTNLVKLGKKIFEKEYAVVKTYRAWTYLQLAKIYGSVPLITKPLLTEKEAEEEQNKPYSDLKTICNYFINDLAPYVDTKLPQYGAIDGKPSEKFFIPVRVLLGELCLWVGDYQKAAEYLYTYIKKKELVTGTGRSSWGVTNLNFATAWRSEGATTGLTSSTGEEQIAYIPMESSEYFGQKSLLEDIYSSTFNNNYYYQVTISTPYRQLSASQDYWLLSQTSETKKDTVCAPKGIFERAIYDGDLRLGSYYTYFTENQSETSSYASLRQTVKNIPTGFVSLYRRQYVYLLFAEALCRAGYPESAFCILKYGLRKQNIERYISETERTKAGDLLNFNNLVFTENNTQGIHARGCGDVEYDSLYVLPTPQQALASYEDTVQYWIPLVEDKIISEMALETAFEGKRYYDLMRVALRRNDPSYLADPIAKREPELLTKLKNTANWYLPLK